MEARAYRQRYLSCGKRCVSASHKRPSRRKCLTRGGHRGDRRRSAPALAHRRARAPQPEERRERGPLADRRRRPHVLRPALQRPHRSGFSGRSFTGSARRATSASRRLATGFSSRLPSRPRHRARGACEHGPALHPRRPRNGPSRRWRRAASRGSVALAREQ
jgi:hypothetical protein